MGKILIIMTLYWITNAEYNEHGMQITLKNGKIVTLSKSHKSCDYFKGLINNSLIRKHPIGLLIYEDNEILEVKRADQDMVEKIIEKNKETLAIYFSGHDGIFSLARNHP